ncbi:hypothetical protein DRP05_10005 [Archaeoglobales archaeon]|nr:MAG: hypothetical protein DRP05_10005 [Archaeoglobales archaeon]
MSSGYVVDGWFPSYIELINETKGEWITSEAGGTAHPEYKAANGDLVIEIFRNPNPEDRRISKEIAEQLFDHLKKSNVDANPTNLLLLVTYGFNANTLEVWNVSITFKEPIDVKAIEGDKLVDVNISKSDSLMKSILLDGRGNCYVFSTLTINILNSLEVVAYGFVYPVKSMVTDYHEEVVIPLNLINIQLVKDTKVADLVYIKLHVKYNKGKEEVYATISPKSGLGRIPLQPLSGKAYLQKFKGI